MSMITRGYITGTDPKAGAPSTTRSLARGQADREESQTGIFRKLNLAIAAFAPMGYEDETGFHYGTAPRPVRSWEI